MDNVPKIKYYVVSDLLKVKVTEARNLLKMSSFPTYLSLFLHYLT